MDEPIAHSPLRELIINLMDRLSENDFKRFRFFLGDTVPRTVREDQTLDGMFVLMEILLSKNLIREDDVTFLIHVFKRINSPEAVKVLQAYQRIFKLNSTSKLIPKDEDDDTDKFVSAPSLPGKGIRIEPLTYPLLGTCGGVNKISYDPLEFTKHKPIHSSIRIPVYVLIAILFLTTVFGATTLTLLLKGYLKQGPNTSTKHDTVGQTGSTVSNNSQKVQDFRVELIKYGQVFGTLGQFSFDDSQLPSFTIYHHLIGMISCNFTNELQIYRFLYCSGDQHSRIQSNVDFNDIKCLRIERKLERNDKITEATVWLVHKNISYPNGTFVTKSIIGSIQFRSERGDDVPKETYLYHRNVEKVSESFPGYTLGYVIGSVNQHIERLQFIWYRTDIEIPNRKF